MEEKTINFGEKTEEYPIGYGYCQCGCGKLAPTLSNGIYLHFISTHNPKKKRKNNRELVQKQKPIRISNVSLRAQYRGERWSLKYEKCVGCGTNEIPHWAKGYCNRCYPKYIVRKTANFDRSDKEEYSRFLKRIIPRISAKQKIQRRLPIKIRHELTKDLLEKLYHIKRMSFGDIAERYNCSRAYIFKLCLEYGIRLKTKSEARKDAYSLGKKLRYHPVNKNFFKRWSNEMAYVLGFICADGNIGPRLDVLTIAQKEIGILEKIKNIMGAEQNITHYKHQDINFLSIGSSEIVEDLLKLGITPNKSLKIKFPIMPSEYVNHFIRGNFDGDGSISFNKNMYGGNWRISFLSGSPEFVRGIKDNMEKLALVSEQKIHKHKDANAYNLYYHSKDDINKIFSFFYDEHTLKHELFLSRKYGRFLEAVGFIKNIKSRAVNSF